MQPNPFILTPYRLLSEKSRMVTRSTCSLMLFSSCLLADTSLTPVDLSAYKELDITISVVEELSPNEIIHTLSLPSLISDTEADALADQVLSTAPKAVDIPDADIDQLINQELQSVDNTLEALENDISNDVNDAFNDAIKTSIIDQIGVDSGLIPNGVDNLPSLPLNGDALELNNESISNTLDSIVPDSVTNEIVEQLQEASGGSMEALDGQEEMGEIDDANASPEPDLPDLNTPTSTLPDSL